MRKERLAMRRRKSVLCLGLIVILTLVFSVPLFAAEIGKDVKITYLGQSAFKIVSSKDVVIYLDPYLSKNPKTPAEMKTVEKADFVLVTHGHFDHLGDTLAIAEKTNAKIVAMYELGYYLTKKAPRMLSE
jgi:glyoxylase-like metal-dependent hydrolase (beta-lactamase superfamily II)